MNSGLYNTSPSSEKISFFRSLFRGREDLYPRRFESKKSGRTGYFPACRNAWVRGICEKPKVKCGECRYRAFLPVTDEVIKWHLSGQDNAGKDFVMGMYPMLSNETCFFVAVDFDKTHWEEDALAYFKTCNQLNIPAGLERSRSGKGAHVWIFFAEAIPAILARKLASYVLTETMESYPEIGLDSYDRLFPRQDTLPHGGFGNLIALPLQKKARDLGNSVFVDEQLVPHVDQWAFLSGLKKMGLQEVEALVRQAEVKGRVLGAHLAVSEEEFITPCAGRKTFFSPSCPKIDLPTSLEITVGSEIYIQKKDLHPSIKNRLLRLATFPNPEFYRAQAMKLPTHDKPRMISCATEHPDYISLPRGCFESLCQLLSDLNIKMSIQEDLQEGTSLKTKFLGDLRGEQKIAAATLLNTNLGVLSATTGFGKTVIGAYLIAKRKTNTLILVHRKQLQEQWIQRLSSFLDLPPDSVGRIGGGHKKSTGIIDVALIQSLMRKGSVDQAISQYGQIIVDECHHLPAISFEQVISKAKAKYITGLTATVARKDGHHPIIFMRCGHLRYRVDPKKAAKLHPFEHTVFVRPTSFCPVKPSDVDMRRQLYNLYAELIHDEERNQMMCDEVVSSVKKGRSPIVLTERTEHLARLAELLTPRVSNLVVLRGGMNSKNMAEVTKRIAAIPAKEERVLLATGSLIGEGFDDARLDTLFLTMPISWKGTVAQYVGRLHRLSAEKREVQVYDYADLGVPLLERMFNRRCQGYEAVGYQILLPASAIPGWPAQIPLPIDPEWKADYAGSVRRLVLDGVDMPLAQLFVQATVPPPQPADVSYARSATESFFFRRLKSLPQTAGKFQLNARLNIPFDGWGQMEVDFLCADARRVIELDGAQHLGSTEAYRRDRRKDALLQENGYTVLRFLAEDVGKELEAVLDSILRFMCKEKNIKIQSKF